MTNQKAEISDGVILVDRMLICVKIGYWERNATKGFIVKSGKV